MTICGQCYESSPVCEHGDTPGTACAKFAFTNAPAQRLANGTYPVGMMNSMPIEARSLDGPHLDRLTGFTAAPDAVNAPTAAETALVVLLDANTATATDIGNMIGLCRRFPAQLAKSRENLARLLGAGATQAIVAAIGLALNELREDAKAGAVLPTAVLASTTAEFQVHNYPKATLFQTIVKSVEKGADLREDATELLDPTTGKKYVPFAKATKVTSDVNLMYAMSVFVTTVLGLTKEAPSVYFRLTKEIARVTISRGFRCGQEYLDVILRKLDEGVFPNAVALFSSGEQNRLLMDLEVIWGPQVKLKPDVPKDVPKVPKADKDPRPRIVFGPVTTPMGGPGAGIITDYNTKAPKLCTRFHNTPRQACSAGLPVGHWSGLAGQCAFTH